MGGAIFVGDSATLNIGDGVSIPTGSSTVTPGVPGTNGGTTNPVAGTSYATDIFLFRKAGVVFNGTTGYSFSAPFSTAIQADVSTAYVGNANAPIVSNCSSLTSATCNADYGVTVNTTSASTLIVLSSTGNNYQGGVNLINGILGISADSNLGNVPNAPFTNITFNGGALETTSTMTISANRIILANTGTSSIITPSTGTTLTIGGTGQLTGSGALNIKNGSGKLLISGANTAYTGTTTVTNGTLSLGANSALNTGTIVMNGGTLTSNASGLSFANPVYLTSSSTFSGTNSFTLSGSVLLANSSIGTNTLNVTNTAGTITLSGAITDGGASFPGAITQDGSGGTLTLSNSGNTYHGATTITLGTFAPSANNAMSANSPVSIGASGILSLNGTTQSIASLSGSSGATISLGAGHLTANQAVSATYAGSITGTSAGSFIVGSTNGSTLTLSGNNSTFPGTIEVNSNAILAVSANTAVGSLLSLAGGTLEATTPLAAAITATYTVTANSTLGGANSFSLSGAGNLGTATLTVANTNNSSITLSGGISATAGSILINGVGDGTNTLILAGQDYIPEQPR